MTNPSSLEELSTHILPQVEETLRQALSDLQPAPYAPLWEMLAYHLGWEEGAAGGKRIRPLLVALCAQAAGGDWRLALPAAAAVELVHNFSLIHDDIEDNSPMRRGRPTVWLRWGMAQAINSGDTLFTLAFHTLLKLAETHPAQVVLRAEEMLLAGCRRLTQGQFLDLLFEDRDDLTEGEYWDMISGKTAALLQSACGLGALCALADDERIGAYEAFGRLLGLAFQVQDDYLGIWGDEMHTGKSVESDLVSGKKTLPIVFGLQQQGAFARRWKRGSIAPEEIEEVIALLEAEGAKAYTQEKGRELTRQALDALERMKPQAEVGAALAELTQKLLSRRS